MSARSRRFSWHNPAILADAAGSGRTGLALLRAVVTGELPPPPMAQMLGMQIVEVSEGKVVFSLEPAE